MVKPELRVKRVDGDMYQVELVFPNGIIVVALMTGLQLAKALGVYIAT